MPRIAEKEVYQFAELDDDAKERAREWWREMESEDFEPDFDDFQKIAELLGIEFNTHSVKLMGGGTRGKPVIYYSGFSSQGDGACFEGHYSYAKGAAKAIKAYAPQDKTLASIAADLQEAQRKYFYRLEASVKHRGHYYHSGCTEIDVFDRDDNYRDVGDGSIEQALRDFMDWIYDSLRKEWEWRLADEQVDDSIIANEYEFTEEGKLYR